MVKKVDVKPEETKEELAQPVKKKSNVGWIVALCVGLGLLYYIGPILIFAGLILGEIKDYSEDFTIIDNTVFIDEDDAIITDLKGLYDENNSSYVIEGFVKNKELTDIDVRFELYDENGTVIGESYAYINNLKRNKTYKLKAYYNEYDANSVANYKIVSINENIPF